MTRLGSPSGAPQAELCLASQQYIAADSAIKSIQASEDTEMRSVVQVGVASRRVGAHSAGASSRSRQHRAGGGTATRAAACC